MSQSHPRDAARLLLKVVAVIAVIENGWLFLGFFLWIPAFTLAFMLAILALSSFLFFWLRFRLRNDDWALLGTTIAAAAWPWTLLLSLAHPLPQPQGQDIAWLFGPLLPYAILALAAIPMRWAIAAGLAAVFFIAAVCRYETGRPVRVLIPDGYVGWIRILYGIEKAAPLPIEQGFSLIQIPPTGILRTSSESEDDKWVHTEYYYYRGNHRRRLEETGRGRMIWDGSAAGWNYGQFVGTAKEYRELNPTEKIGPLKPLKPPLSLGPVKPIPPPPATPLPTAGPPLSTRATTKPFGPRRHPTARTHPFPLARHPSTALQ